MIQRNIWRWMILDINGREKAKRFWIVASLLGICMFVTAIFCFFHTEKNEAEKRMVEIVNYVKYSAQPILIIMNLQNQKVSFVRSKVPDR